MLITRWCFVAKCYPKYNVEGKKFGAHLSKTTLKILLLATKELTDTVDKLYYIKNTHSFVDIVRDQVWQLSIGSHNGHAWRIFLF